MIAGLLFLAYELKQNTDMMAAQTRSELSQSIITLLEMERHPDLVSAYLKRGTGEALSPREAFFLDNMANATLRHWENTYYQYQAGLFDDEEFEADFQIWREAMSDPSYSEHWRTRRHTYSREFRGVMDRLVEEAERADGGA